MRVEICRMDELNPLPAKLQGIVWCLVVWFAAGSVWAAVFDEGRVAQVQIQVAPEYFSQMRQKIGSGYFSEFQYVPGTFTFDGVTVSNVAVRFKGHVTPRDPWSFKVDFNRYAEGQKLDGLKKLNLHNT